MIRADHLDQTPVGGLIALQDFKTAMVEAGDSPNDAHGTDIGFGGTVHSRSLFSGAQADHLNAINATPDVFLHRAIRH